MARGIVFVLGLVAVCVVAAPGKYKEKSFRDNRITAKNSCNCVCASGDRKGRVVGGNVTKAHEFPWMAGLMQNGAFLCGATLITRRHVLTAAHCVDTRDARTLTVVLADHDRNTDRFANTVLRGVKKVRQHRHFDAHSYNNDIAVLEMDSPVEFGEKVQAACLPDNDNTDYSGRLAVAAGWGRTGEREQVSPVLRKVVVRVWNKEDCYNSGYGEKRLTENMFCAGYPEGRKDSCLGDSGGPLHMNSVGGNTEIIGVVSWGRGCARPNFPGIYTKLTNYLDWIQDSLNDECLCTQPTLNPRRA